MKTRKMEKRKIINKGKEEKEKEDIVNRKMKMEKRRKKKL